MMKYILVAILGVSVFAAQKKYNDYEIKLSHGQTKLQVWKSKPNHISVMIHILAD